MSYDIEKKFPRETIDQACLVCENIRRSNEAQDQNFLTFEMQMKKIFSNLTNEELALLYNYGMQSTR